MTAQEHIQTRLNNLHEPILGSINKQSMGDKELYSLVYAKLMSKKFRKLKATKACEVVVERVIKHAIETKSPIVISTLFGGNKLWRFDEAPDIDWAELFNLFYYIDWMKTLVAIYPYGATIDYYSQDVSVESLNNVPRSETDNYSKTYRELITWLQPYLPDNIELTYRRHYEEFKNPNDYYKELELGKQEVLKQNGGNLPKLTDAMRAATILNVKPKPDQDKDPLWCEKVELEHQAIFRTKTLGKYLSDPDIITLCPTNYENADSIITGSTKRSYAKFWAGVGALQKEGDKFYELVLTPNQLSSSNVGWENINIEGLPGKNFNRIRILN